MKGSGLGSDPTDNYTYRDRALDENTPALMGQRSETTSLAIRLQYQMNGVVQLIGGLEASDQENLRWNLGMALRW